MLRLISENALPCAELNDECYSYTLKDLRQSPTQSVQIIRACDWEYVELTTVYLCFD